MFKRNITSLSSMRLLMVIINFLIIFFYSSVFLLGTKYIIDNNLSRDFLDKINYIPRNPLFIFFWSLILYYILIFIIYNYPEKIKENRILNLLYSLFELIICFLIIITLYMGYNGIILLVFCDTVYRIQKDKSLNWVIGILVVIYLLGSYEVFSNFLNMPNPIVYFEIFQSAPRGVLYLIKNLAETINIIVFVLFMIIYLVDQLQENERINQELNMINQVNRDLENYATITEKIGESNERKRLARELHDTLGHALTGIAAGIDACLAMIDTNPSATKQQLGVVSKVVRQGIGDVRNSLNKLRPGALEEKGLKGAIEKMILEFSSVSDIEIELNYKLENIDFDITKEDIIFRIIQESITNALRHGRATHISIALSMIEQSLVLIIQDNGEGCSHIQYGFGLKQMKERVGIINGEVEFNGECGFKIQVRVPLMRGEIYD